MMRCDVMIFYKIQNCFSFLFFFFFSFFSFFSFPFFFIGLSFSCADYFSNSIRLESIASIECVAASRD
jgi:hypothetical protein